MIPGAKIRAPARCPIAGAAAAAVFGVRAHRRTNVKTLIRCEECVAATICVN